MYTFIRTTEAGDQYAVAPSQLALFKHNVRHLGMSIVVSSPVGAGYMVTVR